jgi:hypothetical protein
MSLLPASGEFLLDFPSPRHLSSSGSYPLDLSGLGDPTGSNASADLAPRVTGTHKPLYHGKVEIAIKGIYNHIPQTTYVSKVYNVAAVLWLQFMIYVVLFLIINGLYFYIITVYVRSDQYGCFL